MGAKKVMLVTAVAEVSAVVDSSAFDTGVGLEEELLLLDRGGDSGLSCRMLTAGLGVSGLRVAVLVADLRPSLQTRWVELAKTLATGSVASS
jgi:hypothetical protein